MVVVVMGLVLAGFEIGREGLVLGLGGPRLERDRNELLVVHVAAVPVVVVVVFVVAPFARAVDPAAASVVVGGALLLVVSVADLAVVLAVPVLVVAVHGCRYHLAPCWQSHSAKWNE